MILIATHFDLVPALIKMDIEGAEYAALLGSKKLIEQHKPIFILELNCYNANSDSTLASIPDDQCIIFLLAQGYIAIDLSNFNVVNTNKNFPPKVGIANLLFIHKDKMDQTPYKLPIMKEFVCKLHHDNFKLINNRFSLTTPLNLEPGRYYIQLDIKTGENANLMAGVETKSIQMFRYHGGSEFMFTHYNDWVVDAPTDLLVDIYFNFLSESLPAGFEIRSIQVYKTSLKSQAKNNYGLCTPQSSSW